jgi:polyribonucleotide nucleotidyltransferase
MTKPIAGVEVGLVDGVLTVNPTKAQMANSTLQLTLAGIINTLCAACKYNNWVCVSSMLNIPYYM